MRLCVILILLAILAAWSVFLPQTVYAAKPFHIGAEKCGRLCHKVEYGSWLATKHAKAFEMLPAADRAKKECVQCHITGGLQELPGVQCEACHGPGSEYKSLSVMKSREKSIAAGLLLPTEKVCLGCHNSKSPHFKTFNFAEMVKKIHDHKPKSK